MPVIAHNDFDVLVWQDAPRVCSVCTSWANNTVEKRFINYVIGNPYSASVIQQAFFWTHKLWFYSIPPPQCLLQMTLT